MKNFIVRKVFESDNERAKIENNIKEKSVDYMKVKFFFPSKKYKYSSIEEINPSQILKNENKRLIKNIDLRFLDHPNFMHNIIVIISPFFKDETNLIFTLLTELEGIDIRRKELDENFNMKIKEIDLMLKTKNPKNDNKIILFIDNKEVNKINFINEINNCIILITEEYVYFPLSNGMNYIFFPSDYVDGTKVKLIFVDQSIISTKGFLNDIKEQIINQKEIELNVDTNYYNNCGIFLKQGIVLVAFYMLIE